MRLLASTGMLRPDLEELLLGDHDEEVPENLSGRPSEPPSLAGSGANETSLFDRTELPTGAPQVVPGTSGLPYWLCPTEGYE